MGLIRITIIFNLNFGHKDLFRDADVIGNEGKIQEGHFPSVSLWLSYGVLQFYLSISHKLPLLRKTSNSTRVVMILAASNTANVTGEMTLNLDESAST